MSTPSRRGGRNNGGQQRGGNRRGRGAPRRTKSSDGNNSHNNRRRNDSDDANREVKDEDILIALMPYMRTGEASKIYDDYQSSGDQRAFLAQARAFLQRQNSNSNSNSNSVPPPAANSAPATPSGKNSATQDYGTVGGMFGQQGMPPGFLGGAMAPPLDTDCNQNSSIFEQPAPLRREDPSVAVLPTLPPVQGMPAHPIGSIQFQSLERRLDLLMGDDPVVSLPPANNNIWGNTVGGNPISPPRAAPVDRSVQRNLSAPLDPWSSPPPGMSTPSSPPLASILPPTPRTVQSTPRSPIPTTPSAKKEAPAPKRIWNKFEEQPGRIIVNGFDGGDSSIVLHFGPKDELMAQWSLPIPYIKQYHGNDVKIREVVGGLTIGLFRRGCTENGSQASIISKRVAGDDRRSHDFWKDEKTNSLCGRVPFFSPRTPGHVILRLYWEKEPFYTLAMSPALLVRVQEPDFESSVRFILSNFKGKKSNPTSLSALLSLSSILETHLTRPNESAARATWGCIQEARKVLEMCSVEYKKTILKLDDLESEVDELKKQVEDDDARSQDLSIDEFSADMRSVDDATDLILKEKTRMLMSGRASCERKWRDSQAAFAGILRAVVTNPTMDILLRRDMIAKMRVEFELWCPLSEEFAAPYDGASIWYDGLRELPQTVTAENFDTYAQARIKMQMRTLSFDPNNKPLEDILFPRSHGAPHQRAMNPAAVNVFNDLSAAMGQSYQELFADESEVVRKREMVRRRTEELVQESGAFPDGTKVVVFGSSANGFGSPKSDIDMCLQIPNDSGLSTNDATGAVAMAKLAMHLESCEMKEVDAARLTARIPIIMFKCPDPLSNDEDALLECDLSVHNPLAVLNTGLLRTYAEITPVTRVLASIIKKWAKARDINNPARHTLSSYGYILMLIHFLTYSKRTGNGLVSPMAPIEGNKRHPTQPNQQPTPLLPNLQWMDPIWPNMPRGAPYQELSTLPKKPMKHPFEEEKEVNVYFNSPQTPNDKTGLQVLFNGQDLSLAILLASFFRYYAYEFDYKHCVVSLHSTGSRGVVEREVKAELDGWRNYSAALTIEDPFETFYDVAHVLRGGYYHRIRREFAVAYSKIVDVASGRAGSWGKGDLSEMSGKELLEWLCEPAEREGPKDIKDEAL